MAGKYAWDFAPDIIMMYNASGATISKGYAVARQVPGTVVAVPDPGQEDGGATTNVFSIQKVPAAGSGEEQNFIGIAYEDIANGSWGPVCVGGPCKAITGDDITTTVGGAVNVGPTAGTFTAATTPYAIVNCLTFSSSSVAALGELSVFIPHERLCTGGGHAYETS